MRTFDHVQLQFASHQVRAVLGDPRPAAILSAAIRPAIIPIG